MGALTARIARTGALGARVEKVSDLSLGAVRTAPLGLAAARIDPLTLGLMRRHPLNIRIELVGDASGAYYLRVTPEEIQWVTEWETAVYGIESNTDWSVE